MSLICDKIFSFSDNNKNDEILSEIINLKNYSRILECTLKDLKTPCMKFDNDSELIGRSFLEKNSILSNRIISMEKEKKENHKIFHNLLEEFECYQNKLIEAETNILKNRETFSEKMKKCENRENKLHEKLREMEKYFQQCYRELSNFKLKSEEIDWKLRNEVNPKVEKLNKEILECEEEINFINKRTLYTRNQLKKQHQMKESLKSLETDFLENFNEENTAMQKLIKELISITNECFNEKKIQREKLEEIKLKFTINDKLKSMRKDEISFTLNSLIINTENRINIYQCIIDELTKEITKINEKFNKL